MGNLDGPPKIELWSYVVNFEFSTPKSCSEDMLNRTHKIQQLK